MRRALIQYSAELVACQLGLPVGTQIIGAIYTPRQNYVELEVVHEELHDVPEGLASPYCWPTWTHRNTVPFDRRVYCPEPIFVGWGQ